MHRKKLIGIVIVTFLALIIGVSTAFGEVMESESQIVLFDNDDKEELLDFEIEPGSEFSVGYTHSLYKTKQWEIYTVNDNGELVLKRVEFESADAADYYEHETALAEKSSELQFGNWLMQRNVVLEEVIYRIPYLHPMIIKHGENEFDLRELGTSGHQLIMKIGRR